MLTGILINPSDQSIAEVDYSGDYRSIGVLLDIGESPFTTIAFGRRDVLFVDDEGLLKEPRDFFMVNGYQGLLAGRGLFLGTDDDGEVGPLKNVTREWLIDNVAFFHRLDDGIWRMKHAKGFDSMMAFMNALASLRSGLVVMVL